MEGLEFIKKKYELHNTVEVKAAISRTEIRSGEKVSQKPAEHIQNYFNRFKAIIDRKDSKKNERGMDALKRVLHDKFIIKPEDIPESVFVLEQRIAREQGHGTIELTDEFKEQRGQQIVNNQTRSLDKWIDYLASEDAQYSDWGKYWAFRSILEMGKLQKEEDETGKEAARFQKRTVDTVASFPQLNPRALALTIGVMRSKLEEKGKPKDERKLVKNVSVKLNDEEFQKLLSSENFSKIYAQFLIEMPEYSVEGLQEIRGRWVTYEQGSDATLLALSLEGYPLEWCTADLDTAQTQLGLGDFYVYYSINEAGEASIPRVAIRMEGDKIGEIRGIAPDQNLDPYIAPVLEEKMKEFGSEGKVYGEKCENMKTLTMIEQKTKENKQLSKSELIFLYEIDNEIEGVGYQRDPRIEELQKNRKIEEDMLIVFDCEPNQIAYTQKEVTVNTKAYIGKIFPGVFRQNIEYLYTVFPEGRIRPIELLMGESKKEDLKNELEGKCDVGYEVEQFLDSKEFANVSINKERLNLVRITVRELGFLKGASIDKIYERARELGLELCPVEVGPRLRLQYENQPYNESILIGMSPIKDVHGDPSIFCIGRGANYRENDVLWIYIDSADTHNKYDVDSIWVFVWSR